ncbi:helix-turn-helix domain-containing protein [Pseudomonas lactis]|nr:helix-turn-helix transcriptional regulator [Pseudomonas lactis]
MHDYFFGRAMSMSVLAKRIKQARIRAGMSQERLGLEAGLDEMSASTRMNRYELGKRTPAPDFVERLSKVLNVSAAYFYAVEDDEADLLVKFHKLDALERLELMSRLDELLGAK